MIWVKINGIWVQSTPWVKLEGQWKQSSVYGKKNSIWEPTTNIGLELFANPDPINNSLSSTKFSVSVYDGSVYQNAHVYSGTKRAFTDLAIIGDQPWKADSYPIVNYLTFGINNPTIVKVSKNNSSVTSIDVGPYKKNKNLNTEISNGVAYIPIDKNEKLWVTINNEVSSPLFIFADPPFPTYAQATATFPTYNHVLIPTGINFVSSLTATLPVTINSLEGYKNRLQLSSNTLVYVPRGAYLKGNFNISGCNNVKFMGQGIVSLENYDWWNNFLGQEDRIKYHGSVFYSTNASTPNNYLDFRLSGNGVSGLTVINTPFYFNGEGSLQSVHNIKYISPWNYNTDGPRIGNFHYPEEGAKITNSFVFNCDDCSFPAVAQAFGNALYSSCYFATINGFVFTNYFANYVTPYATYNASVIDIDVRYWGNSTWGSVFHLCSDESPGQLVPEDRGPVNILFSGINIENLQTTPIFRIANQVYIYANQVPGYVGTASGPISGLQFIDITASGRSGTTVGYSPPITYNTLLSSNIISGLDSYNKVKNVTFTNVRINGNYVTDANYDNYFNILGSTNKTTDNIDFNPDT